MAGSGEGTAGGYHEAVPAAPPRRAVRRRASPRRAALLAVALSVAATRAAAGAVVAIDAERRGEAIAIHATVLLAADGATAWRVLTDYDRYPAFIPELRTSRVVARDAGRVTVEQTGDAVLWFLRMPLTVTFEVEETPQKGVRSRAVAGTLRALTSRYALTTEAAGVRLDYDGQVTPGFRLLGPLEVAAVERNVTRQFQALADEIERQYAAGAR